MHKGGLNMALTNDDLQAIANLMDDKLDNAQTTLDFLTATKEGTVRDPSSGYCKVSV